MSKLEKIARGIGNGALVTGFLGGGMVGYATTEPLYVVSGGLVGLGIKFLSGAVIVAEDYLNKLAGKEDD